MARKTRAQIAKEKAEDANGEQTAEETVVAEVEEVIEVDIPKAKTDDKPEPEATPVEEDSKEEVPVALEKQSIPRAPVAEPPSVMRVEIVMKAAGYYRGEIHELDGDIARDLITRKIAIRSV